MDFETLVESFWQGMDGLVGHDVATLDRSMLNRVEAVTPDGVLVRTQRGTKAELVQREWIDGVLRLLTEQEYVAASDLRGAIGSGRFRSSALFALVHAVLGPETSVALKPLRLGLRSERGSQELLSIRRWWRSHSDERYWVETTDRGDTGVDLNAPLRNEAGRPEWSYELILHVEPGDIVFHCAPPSENQPKALIAWSRASGSAWEDRVQWVSHRAASRVRVGTKPYPRPGRRLGLEGPFPLASPVGMQELEAFAPELRRIRDSVGEPAYFPFELSNRRRVRPLPAYLSKLPAAVVALFPQLAVGDVAPSLVVAEPANRYRPGNEDLAIATRDPFEVDPDLVERGLRAHVRTLNALAAHIEAAGIAALRPMSSEPQFDLAWRTPSSFFVAEVKSITTKNEEKQLRLGLGQLLRYRQLLQSEGETVGVLVAEREPTDHSWKTLCKALGVRLTWPGSFGADLVDVSSHGQESSDTK